MSPSGIKLATPCFPSWHFKPVDQADSYQAVVTLTLSWGLIKTNTHGNTLRFGVFMQSSVNCNR